MEQELAGQSPDFGVNGNGGGGKRKSEDVGGQQRTKRNRYISIAW